MITRRFNIIIRMASITLYYPFSNTLIPSHSFRFNFSAFKNINTVPKQKFQKPTFFPRKKREDYTIMQLCTVIADQHSKIADKIQFLRILYPMIEQFDARKDCSLVSCLQQVIKKLNDYDISTLSISDNMAISQTYIRLIERRVIIPEKYYQNNLHQNFVDKLQSQDIKRIPIEKLVQYYCLYSKFTLSKAGLNVVVAGCIQDRIISKDEHNSVNFNILQNILIGLKSRYSLSNREISLTKTVYQILLQRYETLECAQKVRMVAHFLSLGKICNSLKMQVQSQIYQKIELDIQAGRINVLQNDICRLLNADFECNQNYKDITKLIMQKIIRQIQLKQEYSVKQSQIIINALFLYSHKNKFNDLQQKTQSRFLQILLVILQSQNRHTMQDVFAEIVDNKFFKNDKRILKQIMTLLQAHPLSPKLLYICSKQSIILKNIDTQFYLNQFDKIITQPNHSPSTDHYLRLFFISTGLSQQLKLSHQSQQMQQLGLRQKLQNYLEDAAKDSNYKSLLFFLSDLEPKLFNKLQKIINLSKVASLLANQLEDPTFPQLLSYRYIIITIRPKMYLLQNQEFINMMKGKMFYFLLLKYMQEKSQFNISANLLFMCKYYLRIVLAGEHDKVRVSHINLALAFTIVDYLEHLTCIFVQEISIHCQQLYFYQYWTCVLSLAQYCSSVQKHPSLYFKFCNMIYLMFNHDNSRFQQVQQFNDLIIQMLKHTKNLYPRDLAIRLVFANLYRKGNISQTEYSTYLPLIMQNESKYFKETKQVVEYLLCSKQSRNLLKPKTIVANLMNLFCTPLKIATVKTINSVNILGKALAFFKAESESKDYSLRLQVFQEVLCAFMSQLQENMLRKINLIQIVGNLTNYCSDLTESTSKQLLKWLQMLKSHHFKFFRQYPFEYHIGLLNNIIEIVDINPSYLETIFDRVKHFKSDASSLQLKRTAMDLLIKADFPFNVAQIQSIIQNFILKYKSQALLTYLQLEPLMNQSQRDRCLKCVFQQHTKMAQLSSSINNHLFQDYCKAHYPKQYQNSYFSQAIKYIKNEVEQDTYVQYRKFIIVRSRLNYPPSNYWLNLNRKVYAFLTKLRPEQIVIVARDKSRFCGGRGKHILYADQSVDMNQLRGWKEYTTNR